MSRNRNPAAKRYTANRPVYKQHKPDDVPDPPEGYGYVGRGVPRVPLLKDAAVARRFINTRHKTYETFPGYGKWSQTTHYGVIKQAHYAVPMELWKMMDYPPELQ